MLRAIWPVSSLLLGVVILQLGNSLQTTLLGVRANLEAFPTALTGVMMAMFYLGFVASGLLTPRLVRRSGHIRSFAAYASLASATALLHAMLVEPYVWIGLRLVTGFCFAGLILVSESWLNEKADNTTRGQVLSAYLILFTGASAVGQLFLPLSDPAGVELFVLASILVSLALVPVALTGAIQPTPIEAPRMGLVRLYRVSPLGVVCMLLNGVAQSGFWSLGALFALALGLGNAGVATLLTVGMIGGVALMWPIGWLSDRYDRRLVIIVTAFAAALAALAVVADATAAGSLAFYAAAFAFGGMMMPLYGLAIAHANDFVDQESRVEAASGLAIAYGVGATAGPIVFGVVMSAFGAAALFVGLALACAATGAFGLYRTTRRAAAEEQAPYVPAMGTAPVGLELDPRYETADETTPAAPVAPAVPPPAPRPGE